MPVAKLTNALPCVDADSGVVADDELVVLMLLHGYLLRRAGADLNLPPNENKAVPPTPATRREAITGYTASESYRCALSTVMRGRAGNCNTVAR
jgi:hypothetical protein